MKFKPRRLQSESYSIRSIDRAIQVLGCFSFEQERLTFGQLSGLTGFPKPTPLVDSFDRIFKEPIDERRVFESAH